MENPTIQLTLLKPRRNMITCEPASLNPLSEDKCMPRFGHKPPSNGSTELWVTVPLEMLL